MNMDDVKQIQRILEMHCLLRLDGCDCADAEPKCAECLAKHLVGHGLRVAEQKENSK